MISSGYSKEHIETIIRRLYDKGVVNCKPFHGTYGETSSGSYPSPTNDFNDMMSPESTFTYMFFGTVNVNIQVSTGGTVSVNCKRPFGAESVVSEILTQYTSNMGEEAYTISLNNVLINTIEITTELGTGVLSLDGVVVKVTAN